jgi:hypothetical protein
MPGTPTAATLPVAQALHDDFSRTREAAKRLRALALAMELAVVGITGWRIMSTPSLGLLPLLIALITIAEVLTRHYVARLQAHGQRSRRLTMRAYANAADVDKSIGGVILADSPALVALLTPAFTAPSLEQYYEAETVPPGDTRLRFVSGYSAFFSSHLLARFRVVLVLLTFVVAVGGVSMLYVLATSTAALPTARHTYVDALLTVVWWYAAIRILEAALEAGNLSARYRRIYELLETTKATGSELSDLVEEYNCERAHGIEPPTFLYRISDKALERKWAAISDAFR